MKESLLFELPEPTEPKKSEWKLLKEKFGILTHHSKWCESPWTALRPREEDKGKEIVDIMADSCRCYDEGWFTSEQAGVCYGDTEEEVVVKLCATLKLKLSLEDLA